MTYAVINLPFILLTATLTLATIPRPRFARRMAASAIASAVLVVLTAVFDSLMIAAGLYTYPPEHLSGLRLGLAPLEDFAYPLCAAFLVPAVFTLLPARTRAASEAPR